MYIYIYIIMYPILETFKQEAILSLYVYIYMYVDFASMPSVCPCMSITCVMPIRLSLRFQGLPMQRLSFRDRYLLAQGPRFAGKGRVTRWCHLGGEFD